MTQTAEYEYSNTKYEYGVRDFMRAPIRMNCYLAAPETNHIFESCSVPPLPSTLSDVLYSPSMVFQRCKDFFEVLGVDKSRLKTWTIRMSLMWMVCGLALVVTDATAHPAHSLARGSSGGLVPCRQPCIRNQPRRNVGLPPFFFGASASTVSCMMQIVPALVVSRFPALSFSAHTVHRFVFDHIWRIHVQHSTTIPPQW